MEFLELARCFASKRMPCSPPPAPLRREILESGEAEGGPVTRGLSPGTQQLLWELDSFPASPGLKDFLGKLIFARASTQGGDGFLGDLFDVNCSHISAAGS